MVRHLTKAQSSQLGKTSSAAWRSARGVRRSIFSMFDACVLLCPGWCATDNASTSKQQTTTWIQDSTLIRLHCNHVLPRMTKLRGCIRRHKICHTSIKISNNRRKLSLVATRARVLTKTMEGFGSDNLIPEQHRTPRHSRNHSLAR